MLDWLACAAGGVDESATRAARAAADGTRAARAAAGGSLDARIIAGGTAGHVLDYDDTYHPGVIHASACAAPAALLLAAELDRPLGDALDAYAAGFEAAAALARASHPQLYERGWHPTAVCGTVGAAVAAARLLALGTERARDATALAILRAGGLRAAFGSDGKALQVGMSAAAGVHAAQLVAAGARVPAERVAAGFEHAFGGRWSAPDPDTHAIRENWIKPWPCCLFTHSTIEAVASLRADGRDGPLTVAVHPLAREAAGYDDIRDGLQAKFSIPYLAAYTLLHGPPSVASLSAVDEQARALAHGVEVVTDAALGEWEARVDGLTVEYALGSPARPLDAAGLAAKVRDLAGDRLDGVLDDLSRPAAEVVAAAAI
jgi:2-methylcitrate dehydratase PrpD